MEDCFYFENENEKIREKNEINKIFKEKKSKKDIILKKREKDEIEFDILNKLKFTNKNYLHFLRENNEKTLQKRILYLLSKKLKTFTKRSLAAKEDKSFTKKLVCIDYNYKETQKNENINYIRIYDAAHHYENKHKIIRHPLSSHSKLIRNYYYNVEYKVSSSLTTSSSSSLKWSSLASNLTKPPLNIQLSHFSPSSTYFFRVITLHTRLNPSFPSDVVAFESSGYFFEITFNLLNSQVL